MDRKEMNKIMEGTCWGLAYCCKDECDMKNQVLKKLGLTKKEILKLKNKFHKDLFKLIKKKNEGR